MVNEKVKDSFIILELYVTKAQWLNGMGVSSNVTLLCL